MTCFTCEGSGIIIKTCDYCSGEGEIENEDGIITKCNNCYGTREIEVTCPMCAGMGTTED